MTDESNEQEHPNKAAHSLIYPDARGSIYAFLLPYDAYTPTHNRTITCLSILLPGKMLCNAEQQRIDPPFLLENWIKQYIRYRCIDS